MMGEWLKGEKAKGRMHVRGKVEEGLDEEVTTK